MLTATKGDIRLRIMQDDCSDSPREWDNYGVMYCWHTRLGDQSPKQDPLELREELEAEGHIILPLYLYDHSGITMSTTPFSCPWDSGQVGFIVGNKDPKVLENYGLTGADDDTIRQRLVDEVKDYDQYLRGDVYGFALDRRTKCGICGHEEWKQFELWWGFYGTDWKTNGLADNLPKEHRDMLDMLEDD